MNYSYIVYKEKYDMNYIIYITKDFEKIINLIKQNKLDFMKKNSGITYKPIVIKKIYINSPEKENEKFILDLKNKSILEYKTNNIIHNYNQEKNSDYIEKRNKINNLLKETRELYYSKIIPYEINNYFDIIYSIETNFKNSEDNLDENVDENLDYLEVLIQEMKTYQDKEKN